MFIWLKFMRENMEQRKKNNKPQFWKKNKSTGSIYLPGSKYREAEGHLKLISCLQDAVVNSAPQIAKYIKNLNYTGNSL